MTDKKHPFAPNFSDPSAQRIANLILDCSLSATGSKDLDDLTAAESAGRLTPSSYGKMSADLLGRLAVENDDVRSLVVSGIIDKLNMMSGNKSAPTGYSRLTFGDEDVGEAVEEGVRGHRGETAFSDSVGNAFKVLESEFVPEITESDISVVAVTGSSGPISLQALVTFSIAMSVGQKVILALTKKATFPSQLKRCAYRVIEFEPTESGFRTLKANINEIVNEEAERRKAGKS